MQIKLNLEKREEIELEKCKEYLQQNTKTKTIRALILLFHQLCTKYDTLIKERKELKQKITQLNNRINFLS
tara:strand:- start:7549 stop:7761 length:213 start_codon:yes stop_codon:yes gene_type:complete